MIGSTFKVFWQQGGGIPLTVRENWHVQLPHTALHGLPVRQCLDEDGVDADALELQGPRQGLLPPVYEGVGAREHEDILALVPGVAGGLDAGVCLAPGDDCLSLGVTASCFESM